MIREHRTRDQFLCGCAVVDGVPLPCPEHRDAAEREAAWRALLSGRELDAWTMRRLAE